ncbi:MAG: tetratricopeptide repeat protein [Bacteroidota bacterium]|nr:tetratricopeptide repeat protein [Bacteroidota bacterium]
MRISFKIFTPIIVFLFQSYFSLAQKSDSLKIIFKKASTDTARCRILNLLIEDADNEDVWPQYNDELSRLAENNLKTCPPKLRKYFSTYYALALNNFGYQNMSTGKDSEAIDYYEKALRIHTDFGDKENTAAALINLGYLMRRQGNIKKALEYYHSALKLQIAINDKKGMAISYNNIAFILDSQSEFIKALEYYEKALKYSAEINDQNGIGLCYLNMAFIYKINGDPQCKDSKEKCRQKGYLKAIKCLHRSAAIFKEIGNPTLGSSYNLLGGIYEDYGDPECIKSKQECKQESNKKALQYYELALEIRKKTNDLSVIAQSYSSLAKFKLNSGELKAALDYGLTSMKISKGLNSAERIMDVAFILKRIYSKLNKSNESLQMYELYIQMKDSIYNEETKRVTIKKGFQIEYEKKATADSVMIAEEKKVASAERKQEETKKFALIGGLILVGLFSAFMFNRFKVTQKQNLLIHEQKAELQKQKEIVEGHQKETLDSIHYAKRIQTALIANSNFIDQHIPNNFIYFNPKDIVSGDFYWAAEHNHKFYLAICDSTGHGVPGAFMSLLNMGFLSEAIKEKNIEKPNEIFDYVRERLINAISSEGQKDGMDGILLCLDKKTNSLEYCAANNEPILITDGTIVELAKDKMPVGQGERKEKFTLHKLQLKPGDHLYLYTDGYADQFGGPKGKKFMYNRLNELLLSLKDIPLADQKFILEKTLSDWKMGIEQIDDVLIAGIKIEKII